MYGHYQHHPDFKPHLCPVCGVTVHGKKSPLVNRLHTRSLIHRRGQELRALLLTEATLEEISKKFGLTRERVRQLACQLGIDRKEVRKERTANRIARQSRENMQRFMGQLHTTRLGRFLKAAARRGLTSELVLYHAGTDWRPNQAVVNGKRVLVKEAHVMTNAFGADYLRIVNTNRTDIDLIAYELPDGRWAFFKPWGPYITKAGIRSSRSTYFAAHEVRPGDKGYTYHCDHNHREAIENWSLLTA